MSKRIGVVAILIEGKKSVQEVNKLLSDSAEIILGRMGLPYKEKKVNILSIIVDGTTDEIGALTGKIGGLEDVTVKSVLTKK